MQTLPVQLQTLIQSELRPSERLVWSASPNPVRLAQKTLPLVLFGLPWTAFALFWMAGASGFKWPDFSHGFGFFPLFGIPFVLIGFGMLSAPYWAARKAASTVYVVTSERAIIFEAGAMGGMNIRSFLPQQLSEIRRVQFVDGSGDLILDQTITANRRGRQVSIDVGFFGIPDVKMVEEMIQSLAKQK